MIDDYPTEIVLISEEERTEFINALKWLEETDDEWEDNSKINVHF